jgi:hypothetical protein
VNNVKVLVLAFIFVYSNTLFVSDPNRDDYKHGIIKEKNGEESTVYVTADTKTLWSKAVVFHSNKKIKYWLRDGTTLIYWQNGSLSKNFFPEE